MIPIFYKLKQLEQYNFTDLKYRMIKYRLNVLLEKGIIKEGNLAYKKNNKWYINISLIDKFQAIRKLKNHTKVKYNTELTINFDDNYDIQYYHLIGQTILNRLNANKSRYTIECGSLQTKKYHIHFATTANYGEIYKILHLIESELHINIIKNKNTHTSKICNNALYDNYINKACYGWGIWQ